MEAKWSCPAFFDKVIDLLESYRGRDKTIRLLNYMSYLISGSLERLKGKGNDLKMALIAQELSNLRVMLRLFDDLAMLKFTISYGTGKKVSFMYLNGHMNRLRDTNNIPTTLVMALVSECRRLALKIEPTRGK